MNDTFDLHYPAFRSEIEQRFGDVLTFTNEFGDPRPWGYETTFATLLGRELKTAAPGGQRPQR